MNYMNSYKDLFKILIISLALSFSAIAQDCQEGHKWNEAMNRCVYTQNSIDNIEEFESCEQASDKDQCIADAAKKREQDTRKSYGDDAKKSDVKDVEGKAKIATTLSTVMGVVSAYAAYTKTESSSFSDISMSVKAFGLTSIAGFVKLNFLDDQVDDITQEMKTQYKKQVENPTSMKDAQYSAFEYLQEEQKGVKKISGEHEKLFKTMSIGYLVSSAIAAYEIYSSPDSVKCADIKSDWKGIVTSPCTVLFAGVAMSVMSNSISKEAGDISKEAQSNVETIEALKEKYANSIAKQCPDGREELSQPYCYCYLDSGEKNENRSRSDTCQSLWQEPDFLFADTMDKLRTNNVTKQNGCVRVDGKFDVDCNCKKLKNAQGENACMKVSVPGNVLSSFGSLKTNPAIDAINAINAGGAASDINDGVGAQNAIADKVRNALKKKIAAKVKKETGKDFDKISDSLLSSLGEKGSTRVSIFGDPKSKMASARPNLGDIEKTIKSVSKGNSKALSVFKGGKGLKATKKVSQKKKVDWGFDDDNSGSKVANFSGANEEHMKNNYDYGNSDIIRDKSASIWKAISKRYTTSGLRRLFDE